MLNSETIILSRMQYSLHSKSWKQDLLSSPNEHSLLICHYLFDTGITGKKCYLLSGQSKTKYPMVILAVLKMSEKSITNSIV